MDPGTNIFNPWITIGYKELICLQLATSSLFLTVITRPTEVLCFSNIPHIQFTRRRNKGSVFALTYLSFHLIMSEAFSFKPLLQQSQKKWKLLSAMSQLSGGQIRYSQQSMCKLLQTTFWDIQFMDLGATPIQRVCDRITRSEKSGCKHWAFLLWWIQTCVYCWNKCLHCSGNIYRNRMFVHYSLLRWIYMLKSNTSLDVTYWTSHIRIVSLLYFTKENWGNNK